MRVVGIHQPRNEENRESAEAASPFPWRDRGAGRFLSAGTDSTDRQLSNMRHGLAKDAGDVAARALSARAKGLGREPQRGVGGRAPETKAR